MRGLILLIVLMLVGGALVWIALPRIRESAKAEETREHVHQLQLALEMYSDNEPLELGIYPSRIKELNIALPTNLYTRSTMKEVTIGATAPGDFTYLPQSTEIVPGFAMVTGYMIVGYCAKKPARSWVTPFDRGWYQENYQGAERLDWSQICIVLTNGIDRGRIVDLREERRREYAKKHGAL